MSVEKLLTIDQKPPEDHLRFDLPNTTNARSVGRAEYYCAVCRRKITRSTETSTEYGHLRRCEYHLNVGDSE